jgi:protein SCO1/2
MLQKRWAGFVAIAALLLAGVLAFLLARPVSAQSRWGEKYFTDIQLINQDGKTVHFYNDLIKGKIVAIYLFYTHCQYACPLETARLVEVQKMLGDRVGKDIFFYGISIDPKRDNPAALKAYMEKFHVGRGWTFLTGKKEDIDFLSRKLGLYSDPRESLDGHMPDLLIGNDPLGQWMRNSALDNPLFIARTIGEFIDSGNYKKPASGKSYAEASAIKFDKGKYLFAKKCAPCHTIGHGDKIGPDLMGVTNVRNRDWLVDIIQRPDKLLAQKDPLATALLKKYNNVLMPNLRLNDEETNYLIRFLVVRSSASDQEASLAENAGAAKSGDSAGTQVNPK